MLSMQQSGREIGTTAEVKRRVRAAVARTAPWLLWPTPEGASSLQIERKYALLRTLDETREVPGAILEVGSYLSGTAAMANAFLRRTGTPRRYVCVDTFDGFLPEHFERDLEHGTPAEDEALFDAHDKAMVTKLLNRWGEPDIELVQGDICTMPDAALPSPVAVCLVDVDLEIPIYDGLRRVVPLVSRGGVVLVDDCPELTSWAGARVGYRRYCADSGVREEYMNGFGVIRA